MILETIAVGALQVNCYVLGCERSREAVLIDPGDDAPSILGKLRKHGLTLTRILATHAHFDHLLAAQAIKTATGARFYLHPGDRRLLGALRQTALAWIGVDSGEPPAVDGDLLPGSTITFGDQALEVRATPGHSPGGVSFVDYAGRRVFTGDALFSGSIGRTDLPGGNADQLLASIHDQLLSLPDDYEVLSGHGPATTIGEERRSNPFLVAGSGSGDLWG